LHEHGGFADGFHRIVRVPIGTNRLDPLSGRGTTADHDLKAVDEFRVLFHQCDGIANIRERGHHQAGDTDEIGIEVLGSLDQILGRDVDPEVVDLEPLTRSNTLTMLLPMSWMSP